MPRKRKTSADCDIIKEYQRNWLREKLKNDPEYKARHYANRHKRHDENKRLLTEVKENASCAACGEFHPASCMDHHHLDPSKKDGMISHFMKSGSYQSLQEEIDKCIPLCANCHRLLHNGLAMLV